MIPNPYNSNCVVHSNCDHWDDYTIQAGDTLYSLSVRYGVPLRVLMACNKMVNPYSLAVGQMIKVPKMPPTLPGCTGPNDEVYIIQLKDSLYLIAEKYNTTVEELMRRNPGLDPYNLKPGLRICVPRRSHGAPEMPPAGNPPQITPPVTEPPVIDDDNDSNGITDSEEIITPPSMDSNDYFCDGKTYTVRAGDTLYKLLTAFNYTYATMIFANPNVDFDNLTDGTKICIPRQDSFRGCTSTTSYIVKYGDTLSDLATKFSVTEDLMIKANPFYRPSDFAVPGTKICIPEME